MHKLLARFVNLGVTPGTPLDLAFAVRASNVAGLLMIPVVLAGASMALLNEAPGAWFAVVLAMHLTGFLGALFLNAAGFVTVGRFTGFAVACSYYCALLVTLGPHSGMHPSLIAFVVFAVLLFARIERRKALIAYAMIVATFVVSEMLASHYGPLLLQSPDAQERADYFNIVVVCALVGFGMRYYQNSSFLARQELGDAHRRIDDLLANVLPPQIVGRLQQAPGVIAESHGEATVLFADLTGFSVLTHRLSPAHLVEVLDLIFSRYDESAARYGIEKIKTIGDCYMAATGVLAHSDGHAAIEAMADFSLEMLEIVAATAAEIGLPLGVRIGISTGSVISGVIGRHKFSFDVWGDTVNLANRMETSGLAGRVQVSESTYWRLRHAFEFETRGTISLKHDQQAVAYLLIGRKRVADDGVATPRRVA